MTQNTKKGGKILIDTIKLKGIITDDIFHKISSQLTLKQCIDLKVGEAIYTFTSGQLEGSYDSKISLNLKYDLENIIFVECSLHKIILGHNVFGGSDDVLSQIKYLHNLIENAFDVFLNFDYWEWEVFRVDIAHCFKLPSPESVVEYIRILSNADFPRRKINRYQDESIATYGSTTAIKFYNKGIEFGKHDRKKLKSLLDYEKLQYIQLKANCILRVEVEIKHRKLKDLFCKNPNVLELSKKFNMLLELKNNEVKKFLREGNYGMKIYKKANEVEQRIYNLFSGVLASSLIATWYMLTTQGETKVKEKINKRTFYRHRKLLVDNGISWKGTDVVLRSDLMKLIPDDFQPYSDNKYCLNDECQEMKKELGIFRVAV